ncbi:23S ribosomal RNA methyltransferase Erm [Mammaliicoccus sciuri]|uniref:23S ribosomal RNA methyltransferase Erm n=1 Tax=Mammaliicoccus sciuri TaxID=1296 RepID=UPI001FB50EE4|nr:23S ribosomal RNA methyltransferase Erm [Mammaliicoccus sciuri]MCJ1762476.1 23S ribosomal RNA methyltransferase Erm [Mammaliicoccus sciuri]
MNNKNPKNSQNFITSHKYIVDILKETNINHNDFVIEIGTGKGHFTKQLSNKARFVKSIEIDKGLYHKIKNDDSLGKNVELVNKNILDYLFSENKQYKIFGNIPYNISTEIVKKIVFESNAKYTYLIVELGFAKRIMDKNRALGLLILAQIDIHILKTIPNYYFHPKPRVESALILLKRHKPLVFKNEERLYRFFVYKWVNKEYNRLFTKNQFNKALKHARVQDINDISKEQIISIFQSYKLFNK